MMRVEDAEKLMSLACAWHHREALPIQRSVWPKVCRDEMGSEEKSARVWQVETDS